MYLYKMFKITTVIDNGYEELKVFLRITYVWEEFPRIARDSDFSYS